MASKGLRSPLGTGLNALTLVAPPLAGRLAFELFMTPQRHREPRREATLLAEGASFSVPWKGGPLAACRWGDGPAVLLVHGWSGRGAQLGAFVPPLVAAGYRVVAFDLPAHGRSPGRQTNGFEAAAALRRVVEEVGPLHAVVAHSFGALTTALALAEGLAVGRAAFVAPACGLAEAVQGFAALLGISPRLVRRMRRRIEDTFGAGVWREVAADVLARGFALPAIVVHDREDAEVPFAEGEAIAGAWPGARLLDTRGLGHRRILWNPWVIDTVVGFVGAGAVEDARPAPQSEEEIALVAQAG